MAPLTTDASLENWMPVPPQVAPPEYVASASVRHGREGAHGARRQDGSQVGRALRGRVRCCLPCARQRHSMLKDMMAHVHGAPVTKADAGEGDAHSSSGTARHCMPRDHLYPPKGAVRASRAPKPTWLHEADVNDVDIAGQGGHARGGGRGAPGIAPALVVSAVQVGRAGRARRQRRGRRRAGRWGRGRRGGRGAGGRGRWAGGRRTLHVICRQGTGAGEKGSSRSKGRRCTAPGHATAFCRCLGPVCQMAHRVRSNLERKPEPQLQSRDGGRAAPPHSRDGGRHRHTPAQPSAHMASRTTCCCR